MHDTLRKSVVLLGTGLALFLACKNEEDRTPSAILPPGAYRCVQGIQRAVKESTSKAVSKIYYDECAEMFSQPACRDAWRAAAESAPNLQVPGIADACRKAYCPTYSAFSFDICRDDFVATPDALLKTWPALFDAILARETGPGQSQVTTAMLVVYARLKQLEAAEPPASSEPASSGVPLPSGSAPSGVPAPPGSAPSGAPSASSGPGALSATPAGSAHAVAVGSEAKTKAKPAKAH